jgi:hypothetical protein
MIGGERSQIDYLGGQAAYYGLDAAATRSPKIGAKSVSHAYRLTRQRLGYLGRAAMGMDFQRIQEYADLGRHELARGQ